LPVSPDRAYRVPDGTGHLEVTRLRSLVEFDMETARTLHADDFQLVNSSGGALSKDDDPCSLEAGFIE